MEKRINKRYFVLVLGLLMVLAGSGVVEISAQAEGSADWLPIRSWEWDKDEYESPIFGGGASFTATITFENTKAETATITNLELSSTWLPHPTWTGSVTISPGTTGTVDFTGNIPAGQAATEILSLTGIVTFDGTEYEIIWFQAKELKIKAGIPGFPGESIAVGLVAAIAVLLMRRGIKLPKAGFQ